MNLLFEANDHGPECPYCHHVHFYEMADHDINRCEHSRTCNRCGQEFGFSVETHYYFVSYREREIALNGPESERR